MDWRTSGFPSMRKRQGNKSAESEFASWSVNQFVGQAMFRDSRATVSSKRRDNGEINLDIVVFAIVTMITIVLPMYYISHP